MSENHTDVDGDVNRTNSQIKTVADLKSPLIAAISQRLESLTIDNLLELAAHIGVPVRLQTGESPTAVTEAKTFPLVDVVDTRNGDGCDSDGVRTTYRRSSAAEIKERVSSSRYASSTNWQSIGGGGKRGNKQSSRHRDADERQMRRKSV
ncbi:hypothetical protein ACIGGF_15870 [Rhodococcus sp. NPDC078407]|uniref:hypothetical protein n=1 Tax=unclassified Rhodococcus (in: high G+C Gram-positive bacteria) TaxID=192944 RepID=UPI0024B692B0|nr:hypothetical protein [Rhodococcus sp. IEGM 1341]MDI9928697.1 hypothetical protein [Rhodococcus sp. IEGM 1341]